MCGIVGYVGDKNAVTIIVDGLRRLEYRGYDSAGVAVLDADGMQVRRAPGRLKALESVLREKPVTRSIGIGHTRWATHGRPSEENAHPHTDCGGRLVVVHNGILENYLEIKERLASDEPAAAVRVRMRVLDRKSTRLNSSHLVISYAVF